MSVLFVGLGGAIGSMLRYLVFLATQRISKRLATPSAPGAAAASVPFPWATLLVNVLGSLLLGLVMYGSLESGRIGPKMTLFLATGAMGGFTTYSSFAHETLHLARHGALSSAIGYAFGTAVICLASSALGFWLGSLLLKPA